eukprot:UN21568
MIKSNGDPFQVGMAPIVWPFPLGGKTVSFRARLTAYQLNIAEGADDNYKVDLEIIGDDAVVGDVDFLFKGALITDHETLRRGITSQVKSLLKLGKHTYTWKI